MKTATAKGHRQRSRFSATRRYLLSPYLVSAALAVVAAAATLVFPLSGCAGTKSPQVRTVPVRELIDQSLEKCLIPENVTMTVELPETLPPLKIDPLQMIQVLQNLITNGIQAMSGGGMLRIAAHHPARTTVDKDGEAAAVVRESDRDFIEIAIEDTGEGITVANMNKLFQPLFTTKARGIGLGLVVCRNLTEANGGRIEVASTLGRGTTFSAILPSWRDNA